MIARWLFAPRLEHISFHIPGRDDRLLHPHRHLDCRNSVWRFGLMNIKNLGELDLLARASGTSHRMDPRVRKPSRANVPESQIRSGSGAARWNTERARSDARQPSTRRLRSLVAFQERGEGFRQLV